MGFSLECFISELEAILSDMSIDEIDRETKIDEAVKAGRKYATECGQLEPK